MAGVTIAPLLYIKNRVKIITAREIPSLYVKLRIEA
jgi:hypothetical protein